MALRADNDIPAAAMMLGFEEAHLRNLLGRPAQAPVRVSDGGETGPAPAQLRALVSKRRSGETLSGEEEAQLRAAMQSMQGGGGGFGDGVGSGGGSGRQVAGGQDYQFGGDYWVVAMRDGEPVPLPVRTGVTDLEYSEIVAGLGPDDEVLLLPSSSLFEQQEALQKFITERFSSSPFQQGTRRGR
jgi:hypothetical protein